MPKLLDDAIQQLMKKGMSRSQATSVAKSTLQRSGDMVKGSDTLTAQGIARQKAGRPGRAKMQAAREGGHKPSDYKYNPKTQRATLKTPSKPSGKK